MTHQNKTDGPQKELVNSLLNQEGSLPMRHPASEGKTNNEPPTLLTVSCDPRVYSPHFGSCLHTAEHDALVLLSVYSLHKSSLKNYLPLGPELSYPLYFSSPVLCNVAVGSLTLQILVPSHKLFRS